MFTGTKPFKFTITYFGCKSKILLKFGIFQNVNVDLQDATGVPNNQNQEIPGSSCDLSSLDPLCNDSEEILRQLVENPFDVDSFFTEFNGADVKVRMQVRFKWVNA